LIRIKKIERPWAKRDKAPDQSEKKTDPFYVSKEWRKLRAVKIKDKPYCEYCQGVVTKASVVDHVLPRRYYPELSLSIYNLKSSCNRCHNQKRVKERKIKNKNEVKTILVNYLL